MSSLALTEPLVALPGTLDTLSPANPAAGANLSLAVGDMRATWVRVISCIATLTTDANVASRLLALDYIAPRAGTVLRNAATVLVTASTAATVYQWDRAHSLSEWQTGTPVFSPLADVLLPAGWTIQLTLDNKQAGDTITAATFLVEKFYAD